MTTRNELFIWNFNGERRVNWSFQVSSFFCFVDKDIKILISGDCCNELFLWGPISPPCNCTTWMGGGNNKTVYVHRQIDWFLILVNIYFLSNCSYQKELSNSTIFQNILKIKAGPQIFSSLVRRKHEDRDFLTFAGQLPVLSDSTRTTNSNRFDKVGSSSWWRWSWAPFGTIHSILSRTWRTYLRRSHCQ